MKRTDPNRNSADAAPPIPRLDEAALFLDLDGTLIEFAPIPDAVIIDAGLPSLLRQLDAALDGAVAVLSGRPLATIDVLLQLPHLPGAGQHGAELRHADGQVASVAIDTEALDSVRAMLADTSARTSGIYVEDKGTSLAFHYRQAPSAEPHARELAAVALRLAGGGFELLDGNCVVELKSAQVDKGRALAALMMQPPFIGRRPWMLGDDLTDEPAFAMAQALGGTGVIVGPRRESVARTGLADVRAARTWLTRIAARQDGNGGAV